MTMTYVNKKTGKFAQHIGSEAVLNDPGKTKVYVLLSEGKEICLNGDTFFTEWDYAPQGDREYIEAIDLTQNLVTDWSLYKGPIK